MRGEERDSLMFCVIRQINVPKEIFTHKGKSVHTEEDAEQNQKKTGSSRGASLTQEIRRGREKNIRREQKLSEEKSIRIYKCIHSST